MKRTLVVFVTLLTLWSCNTENQNAIKGLEPVDIYMNLEDQGFVTTKNFSSEYGNAWDCTMSVEGIDYNVNAFSYDTHSIESIKATAMVSSAKDIEATKQFLVYVSSFQYEGSNSEIVMEWVKSNFNKDKVSTVVGGVKFTLFAPTKIARMLTMEKVQEAKM